MDTSYWNLFWTTGMPEAWLMSRNGETPRRPASGAGQEGGRAPSGPLSAPPDGPGPGRSGMALLNKTALAGAPPGRT